MTFPSESFDDDEQQKNGTTSTQSQAANGARKASVKDLSIENMPQIYVRTPLIESIALRPYVGGRRVFLKLENCQPSGSFKLRGVCEQVKYAKSRGYKRVVISSGGNAGLAAAFSAHALDDMSCHVVMPKRTPRIIAAQLQKYGATLEHYGDSAEQVGRRAEEIVRRNATTTYLLHPYEGELLWQGYSRIVDEIAEDLGGVERAPSLIVTNCGGGGLCCGLTDGVRRNGWHDRRTKLLIMETEATGSFNAMTKAGGSVVEVAPNAGGAIPSSLDVAKVSERAARYFRECRPPLLSRVVRDKDAIDACIRFGNDHRFLCSPACGATLAAIYTGVADRVLRRDCVARETVWDHPSANHFTDDIIHTNANGPVVVIVDGGAEITVEMLRELRARFEI